jgi:hypothetical protein
METTAKRAMPGAMGVTEESGSAKKKPGLQQQHAEKPGLQLDSVEPGLQQQHKAEQAGEGTQDTKRHRLQYPGRR